MAAQRDINKIDKTILDNFYKLVHSQENVRLTAASSTFKILNAMKKTKHSDAFNVNLNYSVDRLVAGLASNRALARRGYGTLLLEILNSYQVSTERLFTIAQQKFGHISKETPRDNLLGYFLLISIVLQSNNYKRSKGNSQYLEKVYKFLIQLQNTKSYLEYSVSKLLVDYYHLFHSFMVADIPQHAFGSDSRVSSADLLIIVLCNKKEPIRELLNMDNASLMNLCSVLLDDKFQKRPLHPVFAEVSKFIIGHIPQQFEMFYSKILFPTFFKQNHNELAAMGLEFTSNLINIIDDTDAIKILLNEHVIRMLILSLRARNSLHAHCVKFFTSLKEQFNKTPNETNVDKSLVHEKQYTILRKLTTSPGSIAFDEDSKSSSINDLLHNSSTNVLKKHLDNIMTSLVKSFGKDERLQHSCARQIAYIIRRPQMVEDQATMTKVAKFLLLNSMFKSVVPESDKTDDSFWTSEFIPRPVKVFTESVRVAFKNAYHSTLDHIVSACNSTQRLEQLNDLVNFTDRLLELKSIEYWRAASEKNGRNIAQLWSDYMSFLKEHRKLIKKQEESKQLYPITTLFLFYGLQVIEHELDCQSQLEELAQSSEEVLRGDPNDGSWADILTDQIIAILSATECSSWIRKLCESVFGSLLPHISQTSIDLLCDAIKEPFGDAVENSEGESDEDTDDEEVDDEDSSEDEDDECEDEQIHECSDEEDLEDENDGKEISAEDDKMLVDGDENRSDKECINEDEEAEEYLDDEQMMKLDSVLADMFKLNRVGKKKNDPSFKLRCLDLVKKLVVKKSSDTETINTILATIIPLATSSKKSAETRPISDKIITMLSKMPGKSKYPKMVDFLEKQKIKVPDTNKSKRNKSNKKEKKAGKKQKIE